MLGTILAQATQPVAALTLDQLAVVGTIIALTAASIKGIKEADTPIFPKIPLLIQVLLFSALYTCIAVGLGLLPHNARQAITVSILQALSAAGFLKGTLFDSTEKKTPEQQIADIQQKHDLT